MLGQNGAGKSTLIKILAGVYQADAGAIRWLAGAPTRCANAAPIGFIHQDLGLVEWMSVAENIALQTGYPRSRLGLVSWTKAREAARRALAILGVDIDPDAPISSLPAAERSLVAIARALALQSQILVLDEPTAALPEHDVERLIATLRRLRGFGHWRGLCHSSARRGLPHRRSRHGSARRPQGRHDADRRDVARGSGAHDRRPFDERSVHAARASAGADRAVARRRGKR